MTNDDINNQLINPHHFTNISSGPPYICWNCGSVNVIDDPRGGVSGNTPIISEFNKNRRSCHCNSCNRTLWCEPVDQMYYSQSDDIALSLKRKFLEVLEAYNNGNTFEQPGIQPVFDE